MKQAKDNAASAPALDTATEPLLAVDNLYKRFPLHAGLFASYGEFVYALNGITFSVAPQESYGLVGESGSGKTTAARIIASAYTADHGTVTIGGNTVGGEFTSHPAVQYIFQDPAKSLNPRLSVFDILTAGLHYRRKTMRAKKMYTQPPQRQWTASGSVPDSYGAAPLSFPADSGSASPLRGR